MAWVAPKTWSADEVVLASGSGSLNEQIRDNLLVLSTHTHTGAAGMGAAALSGISITSIGSLTFADQSANPDAAGELQRNGNDLLWYGSSVVNLSASDQAAGTGSLRSLGTSSTTAAAGNHTHTLSSAANGSSESNATVTSSETDVVTHSATPGASNRAWAIFGAVHPADSSDTYTAKLYFDTTLLDTATGITGLPSGAIQGLQGFQWNPATSSQTIKVTAQRTAGTGDSVVYASVFFIEVSF
jgi:hypothetical protein